MCWSKMERSLWSLGLLVPFVVTVAAHAVETPAADPEELTVALRAEVSGDPQLRSEQLAVALKKSPESELAHWYYGEVRSGARWLSIDDYVKQAKDRPAVKEYLQLRKESEPTIESQWKLANFCRQRKLKDQERVHLSAVLELEPDNATARERMGHQLIDGEWRTTEEIAEVKLQAKNVAKATQQHRSELTGLAEKLRKGEISEAAAVEQLLAMRHPDVLPAWENFVSEPNERGGLTVVRALTEMPEPEASLSLARHAVFSRWESAKDAALTALTKRDQHSFVPALLQSLHSPLLATSQILVTPNGRLHYRYSMFSDGQDKQQLAQFDHTFNLEGLLGQATLRAQALAQNATLVREQARAAQNQRVQAYNRNVYRVLARVTDETFDSPEAWWQWWNDKNGVYYEGDKPLQQSYAYTQSTVVGELPPSLGSSGVSSGRRRHECLAGGTPVVTDQGPVAVDRLKMGDMVLAQDPISGELSFKPVLRTTRRAPEPLVSIKLGSGETIRASGGHPFWVAGKGWRLANELEAGMNMHSVSGPVAIVEVVQEDKPSRSFNLIVDGFHSYFAGSTKLLSHDNSVREPVAQTLPGIHLK